MNINPSSTPPSFHWQKQITITGSPDPLTMDYSEIILSGSTLYTFINIGPSSGSQPILFSTINEATGALQGNQYVSLTPGLLIFSVTEHNSNLYLLAVGPPTILIVYSISSSTFTNYFESTLGFYVDFAPDPVSGR